jgi:hypothetical protein
MTAWQKNTAWIFVRGQYQPREPVVSGKHILPCRRHNRPEEVLPFAGLYFRTIAGFACIRNN